MYSTAYRIWFTRKKKNGTIARNFTIFMAGENAETGTGNKGNEVILSVGEAKALYKLLAQQVDCNPSRTPEPQDNALLQALQAKLEQDKENFPVVVTQISGTDKRSGDMEAEYTPSEINFISDINTTIKPGESINIPYGKAGENKGTLTEYQPANITLHNNSGKEILLKISPQSSGFRIEEKGFLGINPKINGDISLSVSFKNGQWKSEDTGLKWGIDNNDNNRSLVQTGDYKNNPRYTVQYDSTKNTLTVQPVAPVLPKP